MIRDLILVAYTCRSYQPDVSHKHATDRLEFIITRILKNKIMNSCLHRIFQTEFTVALQHV
jgi:hypothetical protein